MNIVVAKAGVESPARAGVPRPRSPSSAIRDLQEGMKD